MLEEDLTDLGYEVELVATGDEAIERLRSGNRFDCLITDLRMPGAADGWEVVRVARETDPAIGLIVNSGYPGEAIRRFEGLVFLQKPYRLSELENALESVVGPARLGDAA